MKNKNTLKKLLLIFILAQLCLAWTNLAYAQNPGEYDYAKDANVDDTIKEFLCAPEERPANPQGGVWFGSGSDTAAAGTNPAQYSLYNCINKMYKFAIAVASTVGVFFIVLAGYLYISSEGNQEQVDKAKSILVSSIASIVILMVGYILLRALNPDLIAFRSIQPPSVVLQGAGTPGTGGPIGGAGPIGGLIGGGPSCYVLAGYDIGPYATGSDHEQVVAQIYSSLLSKNFSTADSITQYMKSRYPSTPLTGEMILDSAKRASVDAKLMMALMQKDSWYGTAGKGRAHNPGNVGNDDSGRTVDYGTWEKGVDAVADWLARHRKIRC